VQPVTTVLLQRLSIRSPHLKVWLRLLKLPLRQWRLFRRLLPRLVLPQLLPVLPPPLVPLRVRPLEPRVLVPPQVEQPVQPEVRLALALVLVQVAHRVRIVLRAT
jgi:hypothetical protein